MEQVEQPAEYGSHFLDILEPTIGEVIRKEIPDAPKNMTVSFNMAKGGIVPLPASSAVKRVFVGAGGSLKKGQKAVDIDISAVFCSKDGKVLGAVDGDHSSLFGVSHSGDKRAGAAHGCGDDEAISVDLVQIPDKIHAIVLVMNVCNGCFGTIRRAYVRIIDQAAKELVKYDIKEHEVESMNGLIVAKLIRCSSDRRWEFAAIGHFYHANGRSWKCGKAKIESFVKEAGKVQDAVTGITAVGIPMPESNAAANAAGNVGGPDIPDVAAVGQQVERKSLFRRTISKGTCLVRATSMAPLDIDPDGMVSAPTFARPMNRDESDAAFDDMLGARVKSRATIRISALSGALPGEAAAAGGFEDNFDGAMGAKSTTLMVEKGTIRLFACAEDRAADNTDVVVREKQSDASRGGLNDSDVRRVLDEDQDQAADQICACRGPGLFAVCEPRKVA